LDFKMNDSLFIERGNAAERLLQSPEYVLATNEMMNYYVGSFVNSKTLDKDSREASYHAVKAVQDLNGLLNQWVAIRDQIIEATTEQNEEPDSI
jgi:hypothetical protein